jgi:hypothetical protein
MSEYWFNVATRQVEEGHQSDSSNLMGPYPTREAAQNALATAREKTERWKTGSGTKGRRRSALAA